MKNSILRGLCCLALVLSFSKNVAAQELDPRPVLGIFFANGVELRSIPDSTLDFSDDVSQRMQIVLKYNPKNSPMLLDASKNKQQLKQVTLKYALKSTNPATAEYLQIKLSDVLVSSYSVGQNANGEPTDQISFTYQKIEWVWVVGGKSKTVPHAEGLKLYARKL